MVRAAVVSVLLMNTPFYGLDITDYEFFLDQGDGFILIESAVFPVEGGWAKIAEVVEISLN